MEKYFKQSHKKKDEIELTSCNITETNEED